MRRIFLDHQSSTPVAPEVFEGMRPFFTERFGSPASLHQLGLEARDALAEARAQVSALIHASSPEDIIFTSSGTEAANLAVKGVAYANERRGKRIIVSETEHPAVLQSVEFLEKRGFSCARAPVDAEGRARPAAIREALTEDTILVCVHHANHEIGTLEPISEIAEITREAGVALFVDATASGGWHPIDVQDLGVSLLSLSPHRFYGPKGVGVLYRSRATRVAGLIHGGIQEGGRRAGTENLPAIVGAGLAAALAQRELPERVSRTRQLQERLWAGLKQRIQPARLNGPPPGVERLCSNLNVSLEFIEGEALALALDMKGIAVASGPSCISKSLKVSHVLSAIGLEPALAQGNLLFSLGIQNTAQEIDAAVDTLCATVEKLRGMSPEWDDFQKGLMPSMIKESAGSR